MNINCAFCAYGPDDVARKADYIIDGQAVCQDHVDTADGSFGPALRQLYKDRDKERS
jgi:hypothetical protein